VEEIFLEDLLYLFPALFVGIWLSVGVLLSRLGGWHRLASRYRLSGTFSGKVWRFQSGKFKWASYNNCLSVGGNEKGLYVAPLFIFRFGHPPLFIPWGDITVERGKFLAWTYHDMRFPKVPGARFRISGRLWNRIDPGLPPGEAQEGQISLPQKIEPK
jgi:hypothetical protein